MSAERNTVASDEHAGNDLCDAIEGLGEKTARALPRLGIGSCDELARYLTQHTAEELSESLAEQGVAIGAKKIENEDWLGQARKQAGLANTKPANPNRDAAVAEEKEKTPKNRGNPLDDEVHFSVIFKRENDDWRVTTYDERHNGPEKEWGIEPTEWANWILQQMRPHIEPEPSSPEVEIEILEVQHSEIERYRKLATEVHFKISGSGKEPIAAAGSPFWIQVQAFDMVSKTVNSIASIQKELKPGKFAYKEKLEFPIPEVGRYELDTLVLLLPPAGRMALHKGFTLRVNP
jgi:hypothetical protein